MSNPSASPITGKFLWWLTELEILIRNIRPVGVSLVIVWLEVPTLTCSNCARGPYGDGVSLAAMLNGELLAGKVQLQGKQPITLLRCIVLLGGRCFRPSKWCMPVQVLALMLVSKADIGALVMSRTGPLVSVRHRLCRLL